MAEVLSVQDSRRGLDSPTARDRNRGLFDAGLRHVPPCDAVLGHSLPYVASRHCLHASKVGLLNQAVSQASILCICTNHHSLDTHAEGRKSETRFDFETRERSRCHKTTGGLRRDTTVNEWAVMASWSGQAGLGKLVWAAKNPRLSQRVDRDSCSLALVPCYWGTRRDAAFLITVRKDRDSKKLMREKWMIRLVSLVRYLA